MMVKDRKKTLASIFRNKCEMQIALEGSISKHQMQCFKVPRFTSSRYDNQIFLLINTR